MASDQAPAKRLEEERKLVAKAQSGDRDALRPIFERYANALYTGVILPRLGDQAAAEDVLRDTFCVGLEKIRSFTWQGRSIYAWLRQIAVNKVMDVHRQSKRTGKLVQALALEMPTETPKQDAADEQLIADEERRRNAKRIGVAMEAISRRYQKVIGLRLVQELPRESCAAQMEVTIGHFDVLLYRAIRSFRKQFAASSGYENIVQEEDA